ncbi:MAG: NAD(P)-dependent oxidoreductase [Pseudomonadota bacterium]
MSVLITGTSGFVGGALGRALRASGHHVIGLSRQPARVGSADIAVRHDLAQPLPATLQANTVIHAAALSAPWGAPARFEASNVTATRNVIDWAMRQSARVIYISSTAVLYDGTDQHDLPETPAPATRPLNLYAATKRLAEGLVMATELPWAILRPRAVYGVGDTVLFPRVARAARLRLLPEITRPDGRDPIADVVSIDAVVRFVRRALEGKATGIFHLTDGAPVGVRSFLKGALIATELPGPSFSLSDARARQVAKGLEAVSAHTGWWEPPLTQFGVSVFSRDTVLKTARADTALGAQRPDRDEALARFARWWSAGARLDDPAMGRVGQW